MYGENSGLLRTHLATLLRQHRIQQRLGGKGTHTVSETTTVAEREGIGRQIARYRHAVLVWSLQAVSAASPNISLAGTSGGTRSPAEELRYRLTAVVGASRAGMPPLNELITPQNTPMVESWRLAASAAALGEHDFDAGVEYAELTSDQCKTVLKDAAQITRGLVGLDRRYQGIPGWEKLKDQGLLGRAAETCAAFAGNNDPDYSVDVRGWHPPARLDHRPEHPGLAGIVQGEHNLLIHLNHFPAAHHLRMVLDSQRIVSHELAGRVRPADPVLADRWANRAATYAALVQETRNVRGLIGNSGAAAGAGDIVATRAQRLAPDTEHDTKSLKRLDQLFTRIDARLADVIEHGVTERLYFVRARLPRVADHAEGLVHPARTRYAPIDSPIQTDLVRLVRSELRHLPETPRAPKGAPRSRTDFEAAISHRPTPRGVTPNGPSL